MWFGVGEQPAAAISPGQHAFPGDFACLILSSPTHPSPYWDWLSSSRNPSPGSSLKSVCCPLLASADTASNVGVSRSPRAHCPHPACPQHRIHAITQLRTCIRNNVDTGPGKGRPWSDIPGHEDIMGFLGAVFCGSNLAPWLSLATGRTQSIS